jgi:hypothetical protein
MNYKIFSICLASGIGLSLSSCKKDWLDAKPDSHLVVPSTLDDYQKLNDNEILNVGNSLGETGSDNYYLPSIAYQTAEDVAEYIWAPSGYDNPSETDWSELYQGIYNSNTVLDGLSKLAISPSDQATANIIKG